MISVLLVGLVSVVVVVVSVVLMRVNSGGSTLFSTRILSIAWGPCARKQK